VMPLTRPSFPNSRLNLHDTPFLTLLVKFGTGPKTP
jgi:hypothetical protein